MTKKILKNYPFFFASYSDVVWSSSRLKDSDEIFRKEQNFFLCILGRLNLLGSFESLNEKSRTILNILLLRDFNNTFETLKVPGVEK